MPICRRDRSGFRNPTLPSDLDHTGFYRQIPHRLTLDSSLIKHQEHHGVKLIVYRRPDGDEM